MTRSSILWPYRLAVAALVVLLATLTFLFLRGPDFVQRWYYPLPMEYRESIAQSASRHRVNPYLVAAVIHVESNWDSSATSPAGALGLMQVLPSTASEMELLGIVDTRDVLDPERAMSSAGPAPLFDPAINIEFGTAYLRYLVNRYHEIEPALAAYNAGLGNVDQWIADGVDIRETIEYPETRHYVLRVVRARDVFERLYPDAFDN